MKRLFLLFGALLNCWLMLTISGCNQDPPTKQQLVLKDSLMYRGDAARPYSGPCQEFYDNGQQKYLAAYVEGRLEGNYLEWYENGQLKYQIDYEQGIATGDPVSWFEDGSPKLSDAAAVKLLQPVIDEKVGYFTFNVKATEFQFSSSHYLASSRRSWQGYQSDMQRAGLVKGKVFETSERRINPLRHMEAGILFTYRGDLTARAKKHALSLEKRSEYRKQYEVRIGHYEFSELIGVFQNAPKVAEVEYYVAFRPTVFNGHAKRYASSHYSDPIKISTKREKRKVEIRYYEGKGWKLNE